MLNTKYSRKSWSTNTLRTVFVISGGAQINTTMPSVCVDQLFVESFACLAFLGTETRTANTNHMKINSPKLTSAWSKENYVSSLVCPSFRLPSIAENLSGVSYKRLVSLGTGKFHLRHDATKTWHILVIGLPPGF